MGLRQDWREHVQKVHAELGFQMIRFHGLLDDDMSVVLSAPPNDWQIEMFNVFSVFDFLLANGMRPLIELSFMPELLASGTETIFHYKGNITPPRTSDLWFSFIQQFTSLLIQRYGSNEVSQWFFEVWNEPNCGFFAGTQDEYFSLFNTTFWAIKSVNNTFRVGGPATCQSQWINETLEYCRRAGISIDFISTHEYPTDIQPVTRDVMKTVTMQARKQSGSLPLFYTEYNDGLWDPGYHDAPFCAAFIIQNVVDVQGVVDMWSWWTHSDIFEEGGFLSQPFFHSTGWGLLNNQGIPKPSFRAFQLLHQAGDQRAMTVSPGHPTLDLVALYTRASLNGTFPTPPRLTVLIYNHNVPGGPIDKETACVTVRGIGSRVAGSMLFLRQIDDTHANAPRIWSDAMGRPKYLTAAQVATLKAASEMVVEALPLTRPVGTNDIVFTLPLRPEGVAAVDIPLLTV